VYRGASAVIIVFDSTSEESFRNVTKWLEEVNELDPEGRIEKVLVGNKVDMTSVRVIQIPKAKELSGKFGMPFYEASAKSDQGIEDLFTAVTKRLIKRRREEEKTKNSAPHSNPIQPQAEPQSSSSCC
jgi:GTPase SAR1 family protein